MKHGEPISEMASGRTTTVLLTDSNRGPSPARLAIGLSKMGFDVAAICPMPGHPLLKTRAVRQLFPYNGRDPLGSLRSAIEKAKPYLVIPSDDRGVRHLHRLHEKSVKLGKSGSHLTALIERSLGAPESYPIVSGRFELLKAAEAQGIRIADSDVVNQFGDIKIWGNQHPLPWVLKVDGTWGGRGVRIAHTLEEAREFFAELTRTRGIAEVSKALIMNRDRAWIWNGKTEPKQVMVQSHIAGRPANCAVVCWQGKVLAGIGVEVITSHGEKGPASIVRVVESAAMMSAAERLAGRLRLSGFFGLDFMIEYGSDLAYLIEMNPRCTPLCHLQLGNGRDMVSALWTQVSGRPAKGIPPATGKEMIAYFPQALNCESETLKSCYLDRPDENPGLVEELLNPWSERSALGRLVDLVRQLSAKDKSPKDYVFKGAVSTTKDSDQIIKLTAANSLHR